MLYYGTVKKNAKSAAKKASRSSSAPDDEGLVPASPKSILDRPIVKPKQEVIQTQANIFVKERLCKMNRIIESNESYLLLSSFLICFSGQFELYGLLIC